MSVEVVRFEAKHFARLKEVGAVPTTLVDFLTEDRIRAAEGNRYSFTILDKDSQEVLFSGGLVEWWQGRGEVWAFFNPGHPHQFLSIHRAVVRFFEVCDVRRIEAVVLKGFNPGHRWMKMLGFTMDGWCLRKYTPAAEDVTLYSRVRGGRE